MATLKGLAPTTMVSTTVLLAVLITETLPEPELTTYANGCAKTEAVKVRKTINTDNTQANLLNILSSIQHYCLL